MFSFIRLSCICSDNITLLYSIIHITILVYLLQYKYLCSLFDKNKKLVLFTVSVSVSVGDFGILSLSVLEISLDVGIISSRSHSFLVAFPSFQSRSHRVLVAVVVVPSSESHLIVRVVEIVATQPLSQLLLHFCFCCCYCSSCRNRTFSPSSESSESSESHRFRTEGRIKLLNPTKLQTTQQVRSL